ncbi:MAG: fatty acid desaturase, partial [Pseudomonadota bacterium]
ASARQLNQWLAFIHWDFGTGLSAAWWRDKHHRHHANTNRPTVDADLYSFLTYSDEEAQNATGLKRLIARHQVAWFISLSPFTRWFFLLLSLNFVARRPRLWLGHAVAISAHFVLAFALFSAVDDLWRGIALYTLASIITGVYMVYVFAPNHTGMPLNCDGPIDYRDQLRATRNIRTGPIGDVVWVGLNYQIEHHLFPQLPRGQLHRASHIVATWCAEQNLPYHRQSSTDGWRDVFSSFHSVRDAAARQVGRA